MTERSNDAPDDAAGESTEERAEEAPDLTDADLAAATEDAEFEVEGGLEDGGRDEDEGREEADSAPAAVAPLGARARAEQARARAAARAEEARGGRAPRATRTQLPIDPSLRIKDPTSAVFVAGTILVFVLIFLNAMAFGHGGAFSPTRAPATPAPTESAAPSGSPGASGSATPSGSPSASGPAPTSTPIQSGSPAP